MNRKRYSQKFVATYTLISTQENFKIIWYKGRPQGATGFQRFISSNIMYITPQTDWFLWDDQNLQNWKKKSNLSIDRVMYNALPFMLTTYFWVKKYILIAFLAQLQNFIPLGLFETYWNYQLQNFFGKKKIYL